MRKLPPLNAVKTFEVLAKNKNFTKAAEELFVTQGAVSKQIMLLESYLGIKLFIRKHRELKLTADGESYLASVNAALEALENATSRLLRKSTDAEVLKINVLPTFGSRWLVPRIEDFKRKNPNISVVIETGDGGFDFNNMDADIVIRSSQSPSWKKYHYEEIMGEELIPVCSPKLKIGLIDDIKKYEVLQHTTRPEMWAEYLKSVGRDDIKIRHHIGFEHFFMLIQAAIDGMGIVLVPKFLVGGELRSGALVQAFESNFQSPYRLYLVCPRRGLELKKVRLFKDWILSSAK